MWTTRVRDQIRRWRVTRLANRAIRKCHRDCCMFPRVAVGKRLCIVNDHLVSSKPGLGPTVQLVSSWWCSAGAFWPVWQATDHLRGEESVEIPENSDALEIGTREPVSPYLYTLRSKQFVLELEHNISTQVGRFLTVWAPKPPTGL